MSPRQQIPLGGRGRRVSVVTHCTDFPISPPDEKDGVTQGFSNFNRHQNHLESVLQTPITGPYPRVSDSLGPWRKGMKIRPENEGKGVSEALERSGDGLTCTGRARRA